MALTSTRTLTTEVIARREITRSAEHRPELPPYASTFLERLRTSWPEAAWDEETDLVAYTRQLRNLSREQTRELYYRLRERYTFRPSVAEVRVVVEELVYVAPPPPRFEMSPLTAVCILADPRASEGNIAQARRVLPHGALPATGEGIGRTRAREMCNALRRRSGLPEKESRASTSKYSPAHISQKGI